MKRFLLVFCVLCLMAGRSAAGETNTPSFTFGVIADVQWADKETRGARHYREALDRLEECVADLNGRDLAFTIQLGDLIDGNETPEQTASDLDRVVETFNGLSMPTYHVIGNHCLEAHVKLLQEKLKLKRFYYDFTVSQAPHWRFIVLDGNDAGYGVLGKAQLEWLRQRLALAQNNREQVIVFNHFALLQAAAKHHRMEKPAPVLELINNSGCVAAYFAGHDHAGGYTIDNGIHHITVKGMVEAPKRNAYAIIEISPGKLVETGFGKEPSRELDLRLKRSRMERLDRGVVAVAVEGDGVHVGWRLLGTDPAKIAFDVLRDGKKVNAAPITDTTHFIDRQGRPAARYQVRAKLGGKALSTSQMTEVWAQQYLDIPLSPPAPFMLPDGQQPAYTPGDASVGDLDGDGSYELVLKWVGRESDNSQQGFTSPTILEALELDGTSLWRINLGINVRAGAHYTQFIVYDLDGDGSAEVACLTSDGSMDGVGNILGQADVDHRDTDGRTLAAPERLTLFNGKTGAAMAMVPFEPARGNIRVWGDDYGNRSERHLACVAYLDGRRPSLVLARGYYTGRPNMGPGRTALVSWDWRNGHLTKRWTFDTLGNDEYAGYIGQGTHSIAAGDIDGDGRDEILYGSMAVDDNGRGLYTTGMGHGDAHHLSDFDPTRPGLEFFMPHEEAAPGKIPGMSLRDARTGKLLWGIPVDQRRDVGRGACADIFAGSPGAEAWGVDQYLYSCKGEVVGPAPGSPPNFLVWWDGDPVRELLNKNWIAKYNPEAKNAMDRLLTAEGCTSINGTKATPVLSADLLGDWREEVIWRRADDRALRLYTTTCPTPHRMITLMHDPVYRLSVAWQNVAYNQPPHPGFYLEGGMEEAPR